MGEPPGGQHFDLFKLEGACVELVVLALLLQQLLVRAALYYAAVLKDYYHVRVLDGREPVGYDEHSPSLHERIHASLDNGLGAGVDGACRLVEYHDGRVGHGGAGDGEQLALALGEVRSVPGQQGVVALRQAGDEIVSARELRRGDALFVRSIQAAVADVLHDRAREKIRILQDDAQRAAQVAFAYLRNVYAVIAYFAVRNVVEAVEQVRDGGLARARSADEGDLLPGLGVERDVVQDGLALLVLKVHVEHAHVAAQGDVGDGAVGAVRVLPGPEAGALCALDILAVFLARVHEGDIALVRLGFFVQQGKDALRACDAHDDGVYLMRYLADVAGEGFGHVQERHDDADAEGQAGNAHIRHAADEEEPARDGHYDVEYVADVVQDGAEGVGVFVGLLALAEELLVQAVEVRLALLLVAEDLDDLHSAHHLLREALDLAERRLLAEEETGGLAAYASRQEEHEDDAREHHQGEPEAVVEHDAEHCRDHDGRGQQLREALGHHLAQGVDVVGVVAHDIAVAVGVEILDGQALHLVEHTAAQLFERALGDDGHELVESQARYERNAVEARKDSHKTEYRPLGRGPVAGLPALFYDRDDVLHEDGGQGAHHGVHDDADEGERQHDRIELAYGTQQAAHDGAGILVVFHSSAPALFCEVYISR